MILMSPISGREWSGRRDLNPRPLDPQSSALPGCATPRRASNRTRGRFQACVAPPVHAFACLIRQLDVREHAPAETTPARSAAARDARNSRVDRDEVALAVLEPGTLRAVRHVHDAVLCLEGRVVVLLDLDAVALQVTDRGHHVLNLERHLRVLAGRLAHALEHEKAGFARAIKRAAVGLLLCRL